MVARDDVFIALSNSGESDELLAIIPLVKRQGAKLIVIDPRRIDLVKSAHVLAEHHLALRPGTNVAIIDPDLHKLFPDSDAVNRALRDYVDKRKASA